MDVTMDKSGEISVAGVTFRYRDSGSGDAILWLGDAEKSPALRGRVGAQHRVASLQPLSATAAPGATAIAEAAASLGLSRLALIADSNHAAAALGLALAQPSLPTAVVLLAPTLITAGGQAASVENEALLAGLNALTIPVLALFGTRDRLAPPEAARHYRAKMPNCTIVLVYDAGHELGADRPEAVAELVTDFIARGERFLVRQESDQLYP
jgi:pimeloyl-ACP methyl ester carboxylesterase